jgi:hypothetical protein
MRRATAVLLALLLAGLGYLYVTPARHGAPDFAHVAKPLAGLDRGALPVLMLPKKDLDAGIGVVCCFADRRGGRTSLTVVFDDEDHPWRIVDHAYDRVRWRKFFRIMDVETFDIGAEALEFPGTYAGAQRWDVLVAEHESATVARSAFEERGGRPVVYVDTWNHMFAERNTNPELELVAFADYPVYAGSRSDCEAIFREAWDAEEAGAQGGPSLIQTSPRARPEAGSAVASPSTKAASGTQ